MAFGLQRCTAVTLTPPVAVTLALGARRQPALAARRLRDAAQAGGAPFESATLPDLWHWIGGDPADLPDARARAAHILEAAETRGDHVMAWSSPHYPCALASLPDPPLAMWVRGDPAVLSAPAVAIVGSRAARPAALDIAGQLGSDLARCGVLVVSGLARGVDAAAHRGALDTGRTVAVLGTGLDVVYPASHTSLAQAIARQGALVTEFVPATPPRAHHFPLRNRVLSGLSRAVVVVEAGERSGSLITARLALEQGRDVMVVPGEVRGGANRGGHALLRDGARLVESAADVLEELGWTPLAGPPHEAISLPATDRPADPPLLAALRQTPGLGLDDLALRLGRPASALLAELLDFELAGLLDRDARGRFLPAERKW